MSDDLTFGPGSPELRRLGLIADPFVPQEGVDSFAARLVTHAATMRVVAALDGSADEERPTPVWVSKPEDVSPTYHVVVLTELLGTLGMASDLRLLAAYVPLDMMVLGRTRAALSGITDRLADPRFARVLSGWVDESLESFDADLPESSMLDRPSLDRLRERLASDPEGAVALYFGPYMTDRVDRDEVEKDLRVVSARQDRMERETTAAEDEEEGEDDASDEMADFAVEPLSESPELESPEEDPLVAEGLPRAAELVDYVLAYTRAHLSPVVARGLQVYRLKGAATMAQELKVTKAPRKTIAALTKLARCHYRSTVLLYDRFDNWNYMPDENKPAIIGSISELRWVMGANGIIGLLVVEDQAPELTEQFAGAKRIEQDFATMEAMNATPPGLSVDVARDWIRAASVAGAGEVMSDEAIGRLIEAASGEVERFARAASAAVNAAAARGLEVVDDAAVDAALERAGEAE